MGSGKSRNTAIVLGWLVTIAYLPVIIQILRDEPPTPGLVTVASAALGAVLMWLNPRGEGDKDHK